MSYIREGAHRWHRETSGEGVLLDSGDGHFISFGAKYAAVAPTEFVHPPPPLPSPHRLVGLVVRRPPRERKVPGSNPACAGIFSGSSHTSDLNIGTPVATLSGAWRYRVSTGTGRPSVSILWLGEVERLICNFYLSVAARKIFWADPSLRYTSLLLGR